MLPIHSIGSQALLILFFSYVAHGENWQILFDSTGNLALQTLQVSAAPQIIGQPQNVVVAPGGSASFSVIAANTGGLSYQWRYSTVTLPGETNDTLLTENVNTADEGAYSVVLFNASGSVTSAPAMLWIDSDADGVGDSFERTYFTNLNQAATADFDGDGVSNVQEFLDATDPTDSTSARFRLFVVQNGGSIRRVPDRSTYTNGETVTLTATASSPSPFHAWTGDIVTRGNPITLVMTNNKSLFAHFGPVTFRWTNSGNGDWNVGTHWAPNLVPGSNDNVIIASVSTVAVTLDTPAHCANVTLGSISSFPPAGPITLTGAGTLTVRESFSWLSGTMSGSGQTVLEPGATFTFGNPGTVVLNSRTLEFGGPTLWTGAGTISLNNAVITNRPGAVFNAFNPNSISSSGGSSRFDNSGTFDKPGGSGSLTVANGVRFNNYGSVNLAPDTSLRLAGGGSASGSFAASGSALVEWAGSTFTLNAGAQLNGAGLYKISAGSVPVQTDLLVNNLDLLINGTLDGSGAVAVGNAMNWTGGTMSGNGRTIILPGVTLNATLSGGATLIGRTLENHGTILWTGLNIGMSGAVITNRGGARFDAENAASLVSVGALSRFDNAGTFRKSANQGATTVGSGISFNNSGEVELESGTLNLNGGGTHTGSFDVPAGTGLTLAGNHNAGASSTITGAGQLAVSGGTVVLGGLVNVSGTNTFSGGTANCVGHYVCTNNTLVIAGATANFDGPGTIAPAVLTLNNGTLGGSASVVVGNLMNWTGGTMSGSGRTIIPPGTMLNAAIPSVAILIARTLDNGGTALWTGGNIGVSGAVITNRPGALFHVQNAASLVSVGSGSRFDNAGTFRKSAIPGTTTVGTSVSFNNFGMVEIRKGILAANGGYTSTSNALLNLALSGTTPGTDHGQLQVAGTVTLNGSLSVDLAESFTPAVNDSFAVLTAATRNGAFANFFYPSNLVAMQLSNTPNAAVVRVTGLVTNIPQPTLLSPKIFGADLQITWTAVSNATYRLEFKSDLSATNWNRIAGDIVASSNSVTTSDGLTASNRFYRVLVIP